MRSCQRTLAILLLSLALPLGAAAADAVEPSATPDRAPQVWLNGAFGRVPGADPGTPAAAPPDGKPLDAWLRSAPLTLETDVAPEDLLSVEVTARPLDRAATEESLSEGATMFPGPDAPGVVIVTATVTTDPYGISRRAWLLEIPDRSGGEEALFDIPGPVAMLNSAGGGVVGEPGNGCYAYLCVDVGYETPPSSLPAMPVNVGEELTVTLSDGSAMSGWTGSLVPIGDSRAVTLQADDTFGAKPQGSAILVGLAPPTAGEWLLQVRTDFDRERGWQSFLYRLLAE